LLHIFLAVYIFSFSLGLVVITLSLVAHARFGLTPFRHVAFLFGSVLLLLLNDAFKAYEQATSEHVFGNILPVISTALAVPGNGLLVMMICIVASEVVLQPVSPRRMAVNVALASAAAGLGGAREVLPQPLFLFLNDAVLVVVQLCAIVVIAKHVDKIRHPRLLALVRSAMAVTIVMLAAMVIQIVGQATSLAPTPLNTFPVVQILFYLVLAGILLVYAVQYLFQPEFAPAYQLPDDIVKEYGISPREREIITMLAQGYNNRAIGEKLFISSITVKNHIYHIYQKTGVTNKIQLMNLINSPK
jgi:DNA-binding CsgD family transcriptional regulator/multisubunit Na+/H+ antiporter MnhG subunit